MVTVEAEGEFVNMERSRIRALHRRDGSGSGAARPPSEAGWAP